MITEQVKNWHVLIVDDHTDSREVATFTMQVHGAQVLTAANGIEGLALLQSADVTFVLLDLSMPEMDGWEMVQRLRSNKRTMDIPVIALTAHAMVGDEEKVLAAGFDGYLTKPFSPLTFIQDLMDTFNKKPGLLDRINNRITLSTGELIKSNGRQ